MRFFLRSKKVKIIAFISLCLITVMIVCAFTGFPAPQTNIFTSLFSPVQRLFSDISNNVENFNKKLGDNQKLLEKIEQLEKENSDKNKKLIEFENTKRENEFYQQYLEIKENNPSYKFAPAMVIAKDTSDPYGTFTINKGTLDGISLYDPVITHEGLVGYVVDSFSTQSIVITILNPNVNISVVNNRTSDSGNLTGDMSLCLDNLTKMIYLSKDNKMAVGDFIITSGAGGVFPANQLVGTVKEVKSSNSSIGYYAVIKPQVDVFNLKDVMVITEFDGQKSYDDN